MNLFGVQNFPKIAWTFPLAAIADRIGALNALFATAALREPW